MSESPASQERAAGRHFRAGAPMQASEAPPKLTPERLVP